MSPRFKLVLLLLFFVFPIAAAFVAYQWFQPQGHVNYGTLIQPAHPLAQTKFQGSNGAQYDFNRRGKWILLVADSGSCNARCREKIYLMRQIRLAQGREMDRIECVWLVDDKERPTAEMLKLHADGVILTGAEQSVLREFPAERSYRDHIYLIDPLGNLMMRFPVNPDPQGVQKDIKRLLKVSRIG